MNDDLGTRNRLLRVARRTFAEKGFAAASVRHITAAADANLGAITYHFGSKQALYEAVLEDVFGAIRQGVAAAVAATEGAPPLERIERVVRSVFGVLRENPDLPFLMVQQLAAKGEPPAQAVVAFGAVFGSLVGAIRAGQAHGSIRAGDPLLMAVSVVSQPAYFGVATRFLLARLPATLGDRPEWSEVEEHAVRFIRLGLAVEATT
jgi:AcrR family transcriptional regulator